MSRIRIGLDRDWALDLAAWVLIGLTLGGVAFVVLRALIEFWPFVLVVGGAFALFIAGFWAFDRIVTRFIRPRYRDDSSALVDLEQRVDRLTEGQW